jgi:hypothetical protein
MYHAKAFLICKAGSSAGLFSDYVTSVFSPPLDMSNLDRIYPMV